MVGIMRVLLGLVLAAAVAAPAIAAGFSGLLQGKEKRKVSFDADSLDVLFDDLTAWAGDLCGFPVSILSATQKTFTGKFAKDKAKGTIKFAFLGEAFDGTPGTATWTAKYNGGYALQP